MLWYYAKEICYGFLLVMGLSFLCAGYAYRVNARRAENDPEKKDYHPGAIFLAPITLPAFIIAYLTLLVLRAIFYSISLFIILATLVLIRKSPLLSWLDKVVTKIGNKLLEANTALIKGFLGQPIGLPR